MMSTPRAQTMSLSSLVGGADAGGYTLPEKLLAAWHTHEATKTLTLPAPAALHVDTAAARLVAEVAAGEQPDVLALGRQVSDADADRKTYDVAARVRAAAVEQGGDRSGACRRRHGRGGHRRTSTPGARRRL